MTFLSATSRTPAGASVPSGPPGPNAPLHMTRGRWTALAVAMPVAIAMIGATGFSLLTSAAPGSFPFSYTVPVTHGAVAVNVNSGDITLREAPDSGTAQLAGTVTYGLIRPGISETPTATGANIGMNCNGVISSNCGMNATLAIPSGTAVTLRSNGGDIATSGFTTDMTLSSQGGNLTASNLTGTLVLNTGGGDLNANGLTGHLQVSTQGGNVNGEAVASQHAIIQSGGGDVTLNFTQAPQNLQITASGGNVTVILPQNSTKYDISTDAQGGNVTYPSTLVSSTSPHAITVDSGGGDITIAEG